MVGEITAVLEFNGQRTLDLSIPAGSLKNNIQKLKEEVMFAFNQQLDSSGPGAEADQEEDDVADSPAEEEEEEQPKTKRRKKQRGKKS